VVLRIFSKYKLLPQESCLSYQLLAVGGVARSAAKIQLTTTANGETATFPCCLINVYEKRNGTWQVMQLHISLRAAETRIGPLLSRIDDSALISAHDVGAI
jgi:hypothetical protein